MALAVVIQRLEEGMAASWHVSREVGELTGKLSVTCRSHRQAAGLVWRKLVVIHPHLNHLRHMLMLEARSKQTMEQLVGAPLPVHHLIHSMKSLRAICSLQGCNRWLAPVLLCQKGTGGEMHNDLGAWGDMLGPRGPTPGQDTLQTMGTRLQEAVQKGHNPQCFSYRRRTIITIQAGWFACSPGCYKSLLVCAKYWEGAEGRKQLVIVDTNGGDSNPAAASGAHPS